MAKINKDISENSQKPMIFGQKNYKFLFVGLALIVLGFILMAGGGSDDPNIWNPEIFNFRRIRLAPMIILLGLAVEIYAIMSNPKK
jgi:hypothetical protein